MLRSLYSGISGLRAHQTLIDVTGNNLDTMISGDGYFVTKLGQETLYTRAGALHWDAEGRLATSEGALIQGWTGDNGEISTGVSPSTLMLPSGIIAPAIVTTEATVTGNLPSDAAVGEALTRDISVYAADGSSHALTLTFTKSATGWDVSGKATSGTAVTGSMTFGANGALTSGGTLTVDGIAVDLSAVSGYSGIKTATISSQDGRAAGVLLSTSIGGDGTITGSFSNGSTIAIARIALASFTNPEGLEKSGNSAYRATINSGTPKIGSGGSDGFGSVTAGALEMSNVDLSQEFTNLIVAQRGFQANARIITTSDEILQELTQLKR